MVTTGALGLHFEAAIRKKRNAAQKPQLRYFVAKAKYLLNSKFKPSIYSIINLNEGYDDDTQHLNSQEPTNLSDAALAAGRSSATTTPNAIPSTNQTMQIAGPIIGIFGGIALIAALVLLNTRHRRRQRQKQIKKDIEEDQRRPDNDEKNKNLNRSGSIKSYSYNADKTSICVPIHNKADKKCNENDLQRRFSVTDTLVDSQTASRPNSVCLKAAVHDAPQKRASHGTRCSWLSASSSLLSETVSPTSTLIGTTTTSFMKTAERQLLHHERPSVLDHFDGQFKKNIETYRAQLADISNPLDRIDEQDGQINDEI
ncbi:hypothetical protein K501DRAFT_275644 [Backusella circina FSU 941]|nr:hypothetical protein K501DRAFT_275644 [Backusella circina FSU 941]